jgi:hypothetical protein
MIEPLFYSQCTLFIDASAAAFSSYSTKVSLPAHTEANSSLRRFCCSSGMASPH